MGAPWGPQVGGPWGHLGHMGPLVAHGGKFWMDSEGPWAQQAPWAQQGPGDNSPLGPTGPRDNSPLGPRGNSPLGPTGPRGQQPLGPNRAQGTTAPWAQALRPFGPWAQGTTAPWAQQGPGDNSPLGGCAGILESLVPTKTTHAHIPDIATPQ